MIKRIKKLIKRNINALKLGISVFAGIGKFKLPKKLVVNGKTYEIEYSKEDLATSQLVFIEIFLDDCYNLSLIKIPVKKIIDIGANMGFCGLKMELTFQPDLIISYEPNPKLIPLINQNLRYCKSKIIENKAVGSKNGTVDLVFTERKNQIVSGLTKTNVVINGVTEMVSFADIINKYGPIDLIKMDCEGAEWDFLNDKAWSKVGYLTMEYHLEKDNHMKNKHMLYQLLNNHFDILRDEPIDEATGLILAKNKRLC